MLSVKSCRYLAYEHLNASTCLLRYMKGTMNLGLISTRCPTILEDCCDTNWLSNDDKTHSTSGYVFTLATNMCGEIKLYNEKKRHMHLRHNIVWQLISNGVIAMEFVWLEKNLQIFLPKGILRQLVYDTSRGMGPKPIEWITHDDNLTFV